MGVPHYSTRCVCLPQALARWWLAPWILPGTIVGPWWVCALGARGPYADRMHTHMGEVPEAEPHTNTPMNEMTEVERPDRKRQRVRSSSGRTHRERIGTVPDRDVDWARRH